MKAGKARARLWVFGGALVFGNLSQCLLSPERKRLRENLEGILHRLVTQPPATSTLSFRCSGLLQIPRLHNLKVNPPKDFKT